MLKCKIDPKTPHSFSIFFENFTAVIIFIKHSLGADFFLFSVQQFCDIELMLQTSDSDLEHKDMPMLCLGTL